MKGKHILFISFIVLLLTYAVLVNSVKWKSSYDTSFEEYELNQAYILSKALNKTGFLNTKFLSAVVTDEEGYIYSADELPFEWSLMVDNDSTIGAILTEKTLNEFNENSNLESLKTRSDKVKLLIYVKQTNENHENMQYYLRLKYKVLGFTKKIEFKFVKI